MKPEYFDTGYRTAGTRRGQRRRLAQRVADLQGRRVVDADGGPGNRGAIAESLATPRTRQWALGGVGRARNRLAAAVFRLSALRRAVHRLRPSRPDVPNADASVESAAMGSHSVQLRSDPHRRRRRHIRPRAGAYRRVRVRGQLTVPADRVPGRVLRRPAVGQAQGPAAGTADRAVLDQLHDADVRVGQPAAERRHRQQGAVLRRPLHRQRGLADRTAGGGDPRSGVRVRAVHDPSALRRPRPAVAADARSVA